LITSKKQKRREPEFIRMDGKINDTYYFFIRTGEEGEG